MFDVFIVNWIVTFYSCSVVVTCLLKYCTIFGSLLVALNDLLSFWSPLKVSMKFSSVSPLFYIVLGV